MIGQIFAMGFLENAQYQERQNVLQLSLSVLKMLHGLGLWMFSFHHRCIITRNALVARWHREQLKIDYPVTAT
jgi:hypothetical protein